MCFRASRSTKTFKIIMCSTHALQSLSLNAKIKYSFVPELLTQHKTLNTHVFKSFSLNTKYQTIMCLRACAQHKHHINYELQGPHPTHEIIYKTYAIGLHPIYKIIIMFICSGVLDPIYQLKHQSNIISNGAYSHKR